MNNTLKSLGPVALFTVLYLAIASLFAFGNGNWEFVFYIAVVLVLIAIALVAHVRIQLTQATLWCLSLWGLLHMVGGLVPLPDGWAFAGSKQVFYSWWLIPGYLKYDNVVHAYGFAVATWVCWQGIASLMHIAKPTLGVLFLSALAGMGLGALNEVVEFIAVLLIPDTNVGGYINTGWDMVANMIGAIAAAVLIYCFNAKDTGS